MTTESHGDMERLILEAAEALFLERGVALTSTTMIAKKAGCTQALIHYYFRTKDRLVEAILRDKIRLFLSSFTKIDEEVKTFEDRVRRKAESHFDILAANPRLPFLIVNEVIANPERIPFVREMAGDLPKPVFQRFASDLKAEIKAGRVRPMNTEDLIFTLISLNAMYFLAQPILTGVFGLQGKKLAEMTAHRRKEHVEIIMRSLRP